MKYMGSKARHAKHILPIILADRKEGQWYVEPFVGGANVIDKVDGNRIGADLNEHVIALWQAVSEGWVPPEFISEDEYGQLRAKNAVDALTAFVAIGCSYGGKFWGGYARGKNSKGVERNYCAESARFVNRQAPHLKGVAFIHSCYKNLTLPPQSIIYCDPPYANTTKYSTGGFCHESFWKWCDEKVNEGHSVFVSEYIAPDHWDCVWSKEVNNTLVRDTGSKKGVEKLFARRVK